MKYTLDAENKKIGRIATQAAVYLMGKNLNDFKKNAVADVKVEIKNASKVSINQTKFETKTYSRYSGYPGGLRQPTMEQVVAKKGYGEVIKEAVSGMLPKNKLRTRMLKNLVITE
jgi:large subunit ribosomal protein L13